MSNQISIFKPGTARVRDLSSPADIEAIGALPPDVQAVISECVLACDARDIAEATMVAARTKVRELDAVANEATAKYNGERPRRLERDPATGEILQLGPLASPAVNLDLANTARRKAAEQVIAAGRPGYVSEKVKEPKFKKAMDTAVADLAAARINLREVTLALHERERVAGHWINELRKTQGPYHDNTLPEHIARSKARDGLVRDAAKRETDEAIARAKRGEPIEAPKAGPTITCQWEADRPPQVKHTHPVPANMKAIPGNGRPIIGS